MGINKMYYTDVTQATLMFLSELQFDELESSVENELGDNFIIINKDEKIYWISDKKNLEHSNEISIEEYNQPILKIEFNTILSWQN